MSLETLLDRNKAFAATDAVAKNPQIPWLPHQLSYIITCIDSRTDPAATVRADVNTLVTAPQLSPNIRVSGYVYNTAAGTLDTVVARTPVGNR